MFVKHSRFVADNIQCNIKIMPNGLKAAFGRRLRKLRKTKGWTQDDMAHALGLNRSYLAEIEEGKMNPCLLNLQVIADGFGITMSTLFARLGGRRRRRATVIDGRMEPPK
jgi:transcriptional regulator with XRE-family HTH domain